MTNGVVVEGEPGVGKTTLWSAGIEQARATGWTALVAYGSPGENGLSFAGLVDLIDPVPEDVLAGQPEPQRSAVDAALLRHIPSTPVGPREVGAGTLNVLRTLSTREPVLLAIDDLQWLDAATVDALWFALRRLASAPIRLPATRRTSGGVGEQVETVVEMVSKRLRASSSAHGASDLAFLRRWIWPRACRVRPSSRRNGHARCAATAASSVAAATGS